MFAVSEIIPRGPLQMGKSGTLKTEGDYKRRLLEWREGMREEARQTQRMMPEANEIDKYVRYLHGDQWERARPSYRSRFVDNRMQQVREETLSLLTDIRPTIDVYSKLQAYSPQAAVVRNVILAEWNRLNLDLELVAATDHALFGVGYWRMGAVMPGAMIVVALGMDCVVPIQPGRHLQDSAAVLYRTYKPVHYFTSRWPHKCMDIERQATSGFGSGPRPEYARSHHISEYTWNAMSPEMRRRAGIKMPGSYQAGMAQYLGIPLEEYFVADPSVNESGTEVIVRDPDKDLNDHNYWYRVPPGQLLYPRKRHIVFAGDLVMYDGPSIYWHGLYPFVQLILDPVVFAPGGFSRYRQIIPIQDAINEIGAGTMDAIKKALNQPIITKLGAVTKTSFERFFPDLPGGRLQMNPTAIMPQDLRFMDPPNLPPYVFQMLVQYLLPSLDRHAGTLDPTMLGRKKQVPGGDTVEQMRDTMQSTFRLESRYVEAFLRDAGQQAIANVFQFFTAEQRMRLLGPDGLTMQDFDYHPGELTPWSEPREAHYKNFVFDVGAGTLHGASKDREKLVAIQLYRMGAISRRELLRRLEVRNIPQIEAEIQEERQSPGLAPMPTGRMPRATRGQRTGSPV